MTRESTPSSAPRSHPLPLGGGNHARWLKEPTTALCRAETNSRLLVYKHLDPDCLLNGNLHPAIRDRLARIRELAHGHVATLISVEREADGRIFCVWEYIEGTNLETWCAQEGRDAQQAVRMLRELVLAIEALHGLGLVHGAIHGGNVIVDTQGQLKLTDFSPLLYTDEQVDIDAVGQLLCRVLEKRGDKESQIGRQLALHVANRDGLRELSSSISRSMVTACGPNDANEELEKQDQQMRRRSFRWAILLAAGAVLLSLVSGWMITRHFSPAALPQDAPAEALQPR